MATRVFQGLRDLDAENARAHNCGSPHNRHGHTTTMFAVRRDITDLILEALDIAASRHLAHHQIHSFILDILAAERPDIARVDAGRLVARTRWRLAP